METDKVPDDHEPPEDVESLSLCDLVLRRFENTLCSLEDGFPAAFDSLSEDIISLLGMVREFVNKCLHRAKTKSKRRKSNNIILNIEDSLAKVLEVEAGKWRINDKIPETRDQCGLREILLRHQRKFECDVCGIQFEDKSSLEAHGRVCITADEAETEDEPKSKLANIHPCTKCGKTFKSKKWCVHHSARCDGIMLRAPIWRRGGHDGLEYVCAVEGCLSNGAAFPKMYGLRAHFFAEHVKEEEKIFACEHCPSRFASRVARNDHVRLRHLRPHECLECGRRFGDKDKLRSHALTHTGEKPFACEHCPYRTAKQYNLDVHKRSRHGDTGGRDSNVCEQCGLGFRNAATLKGHITTVHSKHNKEGDMRTTKKRLSERPRRRKVDKPRRVRGNPKAKSKQTLAPPPTIQPEHEPNFDGRQSEMPVEQQPLVPFAVAMDHGELPHIQIPPQHHHQIQMSVAEASEYFLDFEQQQPQQESVGNVLQAPSQSMLPLAAGDEQLAQETVAQILSQATTTAAATHIMLPLPPPPPPNQNQDHLVFEPHPLLPQLDEHQQLIVHQHQELQRYPMEQGDNVHHPLPQNPP